MPSDHKMPKSSRCKNLSVHIKIKVAQNKEWMQRIPLESKHKWNLINLSGSPFENFQDKSEFTEFYEIQYFVPFGNKINNSTKRQ